MSEIDRIPYGDETVERIGEDGPLRYIPREAGKCHDCQAERGDLHAKGCDVEQCPVCNRQLISCEHGPVILDE